MLAEIHDGLWLLPAWLPRCAQAMPLALFLLCLRQSIWERLGLTFSCFLETGHL